jgi:RNA-directed DNA polymerase
VDGQSVKQFAARAEIYLEELERELKSAEYRPEPIKRVEISKGDGRMRPLGIPAVKDRIVQTAVKLVIEPIFEREFEDCSYGFRPGRSAKDALREVDGLIQEGFTHVMDADLESFFDTLEHSTLMRRVEERISDRQVLKLIGLFLNQEIIQGMKRWTPVGGTPQGAELSPLLANIYLDPLDRQMKQQGYRIIRYADDFVVLCRSGEQAQAALSEVRAWTEQNGLGLNADKTHVGDCRQAGQGFEFLGYRFEAGRRWVRKKSLLALRERIRQKTRRTRGDSLACIIADLNPMLRGWFHYFKHTQPWVHQLTDSFVRRRLRAILRKQDKRPGMGKCYDDHLRWPNTFFAAQGLFTLTTARVLASQSR